MATGDAGELVTYARTELLARIRGAEQRVWLASPFLSKPVADEIVTAVEESSAAERRLLTALVAGSVQTRVLDPGALELGVVLDAGQLVSAAGLFAGWWGGADPVGAHLVAEYAALPRLKHAPGQPVAYGAPGGDAVGSVTGGKLRTPSGTSSFFTSAPKMTVPRSARPWSGSPSHLRMRASGSPSVEIRGRGAVALPHDDRGGRRSADSAGREA